MRQVGDPVADQVVSELFKDGDVAAVNDLMRNMVANEYPAPESLPAHCSRLPGTDRCPCRNGLIRN